MGNANQVPVFFDTPPSVTKHRKANKSSHMKSTGNRKGCITGMLVCLANVVISTPFKANLGKRYTEWPLPGNNTLTLSEKIQKPTEHLLWE